jgi:hypothetical protein
MVNTEFVLFSDNDTYPDETVLFSPRNDDETLFASYTLMREKPLVKTSPD